MLIEHIPAFPSNHQEQQGPSKRFAAFEASSRNVANVPELLSHRGLVGDEAIKGLGFSVEGS